MSDIKKFYEIVKSGKYNKYAKGYSIWSLYFDKICKVILVDYLSVGNSIIKIFKNTEIVNIGKKFDGGHAEWSPFILPKYSSLIDKPWPFKEFIERFGIHNFIVSLKKIVDEHD